MTNSSSYDWQTIFREFDSQARTFSPATSDPIQALAYTGNLICSFQLPASDPVSIYGPVALNSLLSWADVAIGDLGSIQDTAEMFVLPDTHENHADIGYITLPSQDPPSSSPDHATNTPRYRCDRPQCFKTFGRKPDLQRHVRSVHAPARWQCDICFKYLTREDVLLRHKKRQH